jgi:mannose-6-phosphate isomerase
LLGPADRRILLKSGMPPEARPPMPGPLYPLTFEPIFKSMLWGGRRLPDFLGRPAPTSDPIGEAWVLSDVEGNASVAVDGPLAGRTLRELVNQFGPELLGQTADERFPLLCKFNDARQELSVQVHPDDERAVRLKGPGHRGKTEAWVILDADPATSRIYAGFREGMTADQFRQAMLTKSTPDTLHSFTPSPGDCVFLPAGTVHAIGANILIFEVQQTSDITYRLYDWDRVDAKTGQPRDLHVDHGLECSDFAKGPCHPVVPKPAGRPHFCEVLAHSPYFDILRHRDDRPFEVGAGGGCRIVVGVEGQGTLVADDRGYPVGPGTVMLLPASVGACRFVPKGKATVLECGPPAM